MKVREKRKRKTPGRGETMTEAFANYDRSFQERVLRTMFQEPDWCIAVAVPHLDPELFEDNVHRWCAETLVGHANKHMAGASLDALKIEAERAYVSGRLVAKRDRPVVEALVAKMKKKVPDRSFIREEMFRFLKNQTFKDVVLNSMEHLKEGKLDRIDSEVQRVLDIQASFEGGLGHFLVGDAKKRYLERKNYKPDGIPSGFSFDEHMKGGGPRRKQLAGVIAPPSGGKSVTLVNVAKNATLLAQEQVLYVSLELAEKVIVDRADACYTGIKIDDLELPGKRKKARKFMEQLGRDLQGEPLVIKEFPAATITCRHIETYIRQLGRKGFYPGVVIVDYADLLLPEEGLTGSSYEDAGNIFIQLRAMAQRLNVLVWTAGQGNRNALGKKIITMKELADSFKKAMHADVLVALCQTEEEVHRRSARWYLMKNRNGSAGIEFPIRTDWSRAQIINR